MEIILIGEDGDRIGDITKEEAEKMAQEAGKNLVMVNAKNHVYRIADEGKLKYEQKQKAKKQRAQQRTHKVKEIQLSPVIGEHDLETKLGHLREFLGKGLKTKLTMRFKKRQIAHKDIGLIKMNKIIDALVAESLATVDRSPTFEGKNLVAFLAPYKGSNG